MKSIQAQITEAFKKALGRVVPEEFGPLDPMIRETADKKFGDYQSHVAMGLAKRLKKNPREVAQGILDHLNLGAICKRVEIAGPGYINFFVSVDFLEAHLNALKNDPRLGVARVTEPVHHVIDFSSPNLAKQMHVGHLRTTVTGEVIARIIEFLGHTIERINHVGDWGTPFGMLLQYIYEERPEGLKRPEDFTVTDLEGFYKAAKRRFDTDSAFVEGAREKVVLLQSGDETAKRLWQAIVRESLRHCHQIYELLGVRLKDVGESFYNDRLPLIVQELKEKGLAVRDRGAVCVFLDGFVGKEGQPLPMIIQKSDGGYMYATTDLAALKYRIFEQGARRLIYVTDNRQSKHFAMLFALARKAGWAGPGIQLDHIGYGMVLGEDRKPFKTREGTTVLLKDLIDEAIQRAHRMMEKDREGARLERVRGYSEETKREIARRVGLAAIKYADLSHNLSSDYVFSWDKMLAMEGNTGPYMLYAYARILSIGRKAGVAIGSLPKSWRIALAHPSEVALARVLSRFGDVIGDVATSLKPHLLTEYLFTLARAFSAFYDINTGVRVIDAETPQKRQSRLLLCELTARTLKTGLNLLSIDVVEQM